MDVVQVLTIRTRASSGRRAVCKHQRPMRAPQIVRAGAVTVMLVLAGAAIPGAARAACGQDYHGAPAHSDVPGGPPLAIGDSVLAGAVPELAQEGFEANGMVCRQMSQGIEMLEARGSDLPHLVVIALGTNGEVTAEQIERILTILGPTRVLALVTPHGSVVPSSPGVIRAAAEAHPERILLLDWGRLASEHPEWLAPDGIHLVGQEGIDGFTQLVASSLRYAVPSQAQEPQENAAQPETLPAPSQKSKAPETKAKTPPKHTPKPVSRPAPHKPQPKPATAAPVTAVPSTPAGTVEPVSSRTSQSKSTVLLAAGAAGLLILLALLAWRRHSH
jgi:hypothetical protein